MSPIEHHSSSKTKTQLLLDRPAWQSYRPNDFSCISRLASTLTLIPVILRLSFSRRSSCRYPVTFGILFFFCGQQKTQKRHLSPFIYPACLLLTTTRQTDTTCNRHLKLRRPTSRLYANLFDLISFDLPASQLPGSHLHKDQGPHFKAIGKSID